jgi:hypothetical protein
MSQAGKGIRSLAKGLTFAAAILITNTASAWDGSVTGLIAGADVTVYTTRDAGSGYCRIGYVRVT